MALTGMEKRVLRAVLSACGEKPACLLTPESLLSRPTAGKGRVKLPETRSALTRIMRALQADGYFEVVQSRRNEEDVWCITLLSKAQGFERKEIQKRRYLLFRIALTVGLAVLSFFVGVLLKKLF